MDDKSISLHSTHKNMKNVQLVLFALALIATSIQTFAQHSVARQWNELLLEAIRNDFARPTVHARNLFHSSIAMYDSWAAYEVGASPFLLGNKVGNYTTEFKDISIPDDIHSAQETTLSYAVFRLLKHRFQFSPGATESLPRFDSLFNSLGHDASITSTDYENGAAAELGNHIAQSLIQLGLQDGSNEQERYQNISYEPVNPPLIPQLGGNPNIIDPNRWQPLTLDIFIDQSGNVIPFNTPDFLNPEWGIVTPFALTDNDLVINQRNAYGYWVYHDPGSPPLLDTLQSGGLSEAYKWGFALVSVWSGHLDPADGVMWDISPGSIGNIPEFPKSYEEYAEFYNLLDGGDASLGHAINPSTGQPYEPQIVPRADYARVLAEFWADGPDSETPPGHWFTILNYVNDHPLFEKKFMGEGPLLDDLEWDIKAYFILGGAVHDAAVCAWGIKGWYDYVRPISAIRAMAERGQSSDPGLPRYDPAGIPLIEGYIELVMQGDSLVGEKDEHLHKIKLYAWKGPNYIDNPETDVAGVDWILAENWWSYQRPSFITPPFAGYISGHSTFSRAAAEVMTLLTGDPFFPGGLGEFACKKNEFLVFEDGPSVDLTLQWATYRDASDQTSLSRIWGGIHPPADDIPGRIIGETIGIKAFDLARQYFEGAVTPTRNPNAPDLGIRIHPNPVRAGNDLNLDLQTAPLGSVNIEITNIRGQIVDDYRLSHGPNHRYVIHTNSLEAGLYFVTFLANDRLATKRLMVLD